MTGDLFSGPNLVYEPVVVSRCRYCWALARRSSSACTTMVSIGFNSFLPGSRPESLPPRPRYHPAMSPTHAAPRVHRLDQIQAELKRQGLDGWLLYDFRGSNPVAQPLVRPLLEGNTASRRVLLLIPAEGVPTLAVHSIERRSLRGDLPVEVVSYASREDYAATL